ncbi:hypothetical protein B0H14DRAFT_3150800 [Mycena olivaceomarginata]|nr:hypothetical protein B0H14DRAFT_3150800 [Mycena olivaceomarginata]
MNLSCHFSTLKDIQNLASIQSLGSFIRSACVSSNEVEIAGWLYPSYPSNAHSRLRYTPTRLASSGVDDECLIGRWRRAEVVVCGSSGAGGKRRERRGAGQQCICNTMLKLASKIIFFMHEEPTKDGNSLERLLSHRLWGRSNVGTTIITTVDLHVLLVTPHLLHGLINLLLCRILRNLLFWHVDKAREINSDCDQFVPPPKNTETPATRACGSRQKSDIVQRSEGMNNGRLGATMLMSERLVSYCSVNDDPGATGPRKHGKPRRELVEIDVQGAWSGSAFEILLHALLDGCSRVVWVHISGREATGDGLEGERCGVEDGGRGRESAIKTNHFHAHVQSAHLHHDRDADCDVG